MNRYELKTLADVQDFLSDIEDIDQGGCGISALAMRRWLAKNSPHCNTVFVLGYNEPTRFKTNNNAILKKEDPTSATHIGLIIYDNLSGTQSIIDCVGVFKMTDYSYVNSFESEDIMVRALNRPNSWNVAFNRKRQVNRISEYLGINLSDIKCFE